MKIEEVMVVRGDIHVVAEVIRQAKAKGWEYKDSMTYGNGVILLFEDQKRDEG